MMNEFEEGGMYACIDVCVYGEWGVVGVEEKVR